MDQIFKSIQRQMRQLIFTLCCFFYMLDGHSQTKETKVEDNLIFEGNELHKSETYAQAEKKYREALARVPKNTIAQHNLGNTLFDESYFGEAFNAYKSATMNAKTKAEKHSALHNMGNVFMNQKDYTKAVETYKEALRNNPNDDQTRYNYALAKELLENEQQNQDQNQNKDQDNKDKQNQDQQNNDNKNNESQSPKDEGEDQKDQDQSGDEEQNNDQSEEQSDKNQDPQNQPQDSKTQPTKLSPQQIKNLLEAMNNEEKKVQDKVNAKKAKPVKPKSKKDW